MRASSLFLGGAFLAGLCACTGATANLPTGNAGLRASTLSANAGGEVVVQLPTILPTPVVPGVSQTGLSPATRFVGGTFGPTAIAPIPVTAGSAGCATVTAGVQCTLTIALPSGKHPLKLYTYSSRKAHAKPLALDAVSGVTIVAGQETKINAGGWRGIPASFGIALSPPSLTQGTPSIDRVTLYGIDAAGSIIPMRRFQGAHGDLFIWQGTGSGPYAETMIGVAFTPTRFYYDGRVSGVERFHAKADDGSTTVIASASLPLQPGPAGNAQIFVWNGMPGERNLKDEALPTLVQFSAGASGDARPLRTWGLGAPAFAADASGGIWATPFDIYEAGRSWIERYATNGVGKIRVLPSSRTSVIGGAAVDESGNLFALEGQYLGILDERGCLMRHPTISVFGASSSWSAMIRQLDFSAASAQISCFTPITVDADGNTYVAESNDAGSLDSAATILEFGPASSGHVTPIRTITFAPHTVEVIGGLAADTMGNLLVLFNGALLKFAPGSNAGIPVLPGVAVTSFATDSQDNIYATVHAGGGAAAYAVEVFAPGSTTPMRTIAGADTGLTSPSAIAVAR